MELKLLNFISFLMVLPMVLFYSCIPSNAPIESGSELAEKGTNFISIELSTLGDLGSAHNSSFTAGQVVTFYAVQRSPANTVVTNPPVTWSFPSTLGTITLGQTNSNAVVISMTGDGRSTNGDDEGVLEATATDLSPGAINLTVTAGTATQIFIEDANDGSGSEVGDATLTAGGTTALHAVARDANENFVGIDTVTWSFPTTVLGEFTFDGGATASTTGTGLSATLTATLVGNGVISADHATLTDDTTGTITVTAGTASKTVIETAGDGTGTEVGDLSIVATASDVLFAVERDAFNNFVGTDAATSWSVPGAIVSFDPSGDGGLTGTGASVTVTGAALGTQVITASDGFITADSTGSVTVSNVTPTMVSTPVFYTPLSTGISFPVTAAEDPNTTQTIGYSVVNAPGAGTLTECLGLTTSSDPTDLTCQFAPVAASSGQVTIIYTASDGFTAAATNETITIHVTQNEYTWQNDATGPGNEDQINSTSTLSAIGAASAANLPGTREGAATWVDSNGNFWLFGGLGMASSPNTAGSLNDLWMLDSTSRTWTRMLGGDNGGSGGTLLSSSSLGGAANNSELLPGGRSYAVSWTLNVGTNSDDLYMFGGVGDIQATATVQITNNGTLEAGDTLHINGVSFPITAGANASATLSALAIQINSTITTGIIDTVTAFVDGTDTMTLFADTAGPTGNNHTVSITDGAVSNLVISSTAFTGGVTVTTTLGLFNDLWKYNTASGVWTLINVDDASDVNVPTFQDANGRYGNLGLATDSNIPPPRSQATGKEWVESGNLYLFGGNGKDSTGEVGLLNDLWVYTVSTNQWTWIGGSNTHSEGGTYGTQGTGSTTNIPGSRRGGTTSVNRSTSTTQFLFHGGFGFGLSGGAGHLSDLWQFTPSSLEWTYLAGTDQRNEVGSYPATHERVPGSYPGGRSNSAGWTDSKYRFFLLGGFGYGSTPNTTGHLNDMWVYDDSTWYFLKGSSEVDQTGTYGVRGTQAPANQPGARFGSGTWVDTNNDLWFFGGNGFPAAGAAGELKDVWQYNPQ